MLERIKISLIIIFCTGLIGCVNKADSENKDYLDSAAVTQLIKTKLVKQLGPSAASIRVRTYRDEVLLSGVADSAAIKQQAGKIAANTDDVKFVRNDLIVR